MKHALHFQARFGDLLLDAQATFDDEIIVISGENGAGKTSLLRCVAGLEKATGSVQMGQTMWLDSVADFILPTEQRNIGFVYSEAVLLPWLSVGKNIKLGVKNGSGFQKIIADLELAPLMQRKPAMLSSGEAQRVALARAMYRQPSLLLLDEPFSAQAPEIRNRLRHVLKAWQKDFHTPILLVSHDTEDAKSLANQHWHMREGKLLVKVKGMLKNKVVNDE